MRSSGLKKGLAVSAISALTVTGVPGLIGSAHAVPLSGQVQRVDLLSERVSFANDGSNATASLVAAAPEAVTSITFQYAVGGGAWQNIATVQRNQHGAFTTEWSRPSGLEDGATVSLRAVPQTGEGAADTVTGVEVLAGEGDQAVELGTEGRLGIYRNPRTGAAYVAVRGTTATPGTVTVTDTLTAGEGATATTGELQSAAPQGGGAAAFAGVLTYPGNSYEYSQGNEPNQVALTARAGAAEDVAASTYYTQEVRQVTAEPARTNLPGANATTSATVTVTDQDGNPVAGASVGYLTATEGTGGQPGTPDDDAVQQRTGADGTVTITGLGAGRYTVYADTNGTAGYQEADVEAEPFTVGSYDQQLSAVTISADPQRTAYDLDELSGQGAAEFTLTAEDQEGEGVAGQALQYRWSVQPTGGGQAVTGSWQDAGQSGEDGTATATFATGLAATPAGTYTLEARRPNTGGSGLVNADPISFEAGEAEIRWQGGARESAPLGENATLTGTLALVGSGTVLEGREVSVTESGDASVEFTAQQPQGTTVAGGTATATTDAQGRFRVSLRSTYTPPPNVDPVPQAATVTAVAPALAGSDDADNADAEAQLALTFEQAAEVGSIDVAVDELFAGAPAPGKPVDLDITVRGAATGGGQGEELDDVPVTVSVDKGFLSPNAEDVDALSLDPEQDDQGDLFGFYEDLGQEAEVSTGDAGDEAGVVAAIGRDEDFDDDGRATVTVTVTAGGVTETEEITFDSSNALNVGEVELSRTGDNEGGQATIGDEVGFRLFARDQFGNLVGDLDATISDDTPQAEIRTDGDFNATRTDFVNSNVGVFATSDNEVAQTLTATLEGVPETLVAADGGPTADRTRRVTADAEPITWVADDGDGDGDGNGGGREPIVAKLTATNNGKKADRLRITTGPAAAGASVKVFRFAGGKRKLVRTVTLNDNGATTVRIKDRNGKRFTRYVAKVQPTETTKDDLTNKRRVR